jgi:membrane-bound lytic murein transglycosylase B
VISRYNKSPLYSMAVFQLSEAIAERLAQPPPP